MTDRYLLVSSSCHTSRVRRCDQPFVSIKGARKQNFPKLSLKKETFQISTMHILCMERFSFSSVHCNNGRVEMSAFIVHRLIMQQTDSI